ncbi:magnesium transporter [Leptolyngbya sp. FACHB-261]|uniref:magnesium transporter n=1 Tax=Leptolyngbya sp. FACHB-261 TaxID=2692806 RepID=UPI0016870082|nr:magnesium transporter [Leptolyngbya sp. FACHB-261]MBD2104067.1 magnesium transporter [Leptolyngbya sp. FACHB-261]
MLTLERRNLLAAVDDLSTLKAELSHLLPVDISELIEGLPPERRAIAFRLLDKSRATEVFEYLPTEVREELIEALHDLQVCQLIESMRPDDRAELFDELPAGVVKRLLRQLSASERRATATILGYSEGTAGRVMTTEYVRLYQGMTVDRALDKIRYTDRDKETIYCAYVTDANRKLLQVISLRDLVFAAPDALVEEIACNQVISVFTETPQEEVAHLMQRYDLIAVPVVDREERLVGIVTIDDVVDILEEEATEDIQKLAGVRGGDEAVLAPPLVTFCKRLPWLLGSIALYVGTSSAVASFQGTIASLPVLAAIMPLLSNTSGNVGIQALTVTVRGLGVGEVNLSNTLRILRKEILAGIGMGAVLGACLGLLSLLWAPEHLRWVSLITGGVMATNVLIAVTLGTCIPIVLKRLSLDPALMSGPLLTTLLDTISFVCLLGLTSLAISFSS